METKKLSREDRRRQHQNQITLDDFYAHCNMSLSNFKFSPMVEVAEIDEIIQRRTMVNKVFREDKARFFASAQYAYCELNAIDPELSDELFCAGDEEEEEAMVIPPPMSFARDGHFIGSFTNPETAKDSHVFEVQPDVVSGVCVECEGDVLNCQCVTRIELNQPVKPTTKKPVIAESHSFPFSVQQFPHIISKIESYLDCRDVLRFRASFDNVCFDKDLEIKFSAKRSVKAPDLKYCVCTTLAYRNTNFVRSIAKLVRRRCIGAQPSGNSLFINREHCPKYQCKHIWDDSGG